MARGNTTHTLDKNGNTTDTGIAEFTYDSQNRRMKRIFTNKTASLNGTTDYCYNGWRACEGHDVADAITQQYTYGNYLDDVCTLDDRRSSGTVA